MRFLLILAALILQGPILRAGEPIVVQNILDPFTSDGCSKFPNGIPYLNSKAWQNCCIVHDIAYWQGGTAQQRAQADNDLGLCVTESGYPIIGKAMSLGVRLGGYSGLPLTWRWGYGWRQNRGYRPLSASEKRQVALGAKEIPANLSDVRISRPPALISERLSVTGDYCLDEIAKHLREKMGDKIKISEVQENQKEAGSGWEKTFSVSTSACGQPYQFKFHLLRLGACTQKHGELLVRGRVRLQNVQGGCGRNVEQELEEAESAEIDTAR